MRIGIIGEGAIGTYVRNKLRDQGHEIAAILIRPERHQNRTNCSGDTCYVSCVEDLPDKVEHMLDCAGHSALKSYGPDILQRGIDLTTVSIGALADPKLQQSLQQAAQDGDAQLHLASGAIGALDCLRAARVGSLESVTYIGRKPPQGWRGSPAEARLDLENLDSGAEVHFAGSARDAAREYPKNANVAAAVALAGIGFEKTQVELIADPAINENIHTLEASGDFGHFTFEIRGQSLPDNPRSSALAAMSIISKLERETRNNCF